VNSAAAGKFERKSEKEPSSPSESGGRYGACATAYHEEFQLIHTSGEVYLVKDIRVILSCREICEKSSTCPGRRDLLILLSFWRRIRRTVF
jgi:hypothetical protein